MISSISCCVIDAIWAWMASYLVLEVDSVRLSLYESSMSMRLVVGCRLCGLPRLLWWGQFLAKCPISWQLKQGPGGGSGTSLLVPWLVLGFYVMLGLCVVLRSARKEENWVICCSMNSGSRINKSLLRRSYLEVCKVCYAKASCRN
jgi:hypothetical protein